jgi:imidazoleglycerol-phosphate dehydratase
MRKSEISRKTSETDINLSIDLDGKGSSQIDTGIGFLDHMLTLFAKHGRFDLNIKCKGDTNVDFHHTVEDTGICLGKAVKDALGSKKGIIRYGSMLLPMDEALIISAVDISGRGMLVYDIDIASEKVGDFDTELAEEFFRAFAQNAEITLHMRKISGKNSHHIVEGAFKSVAHSLMMAVKIDENFKDEIPSTKGVL